MPSISPSNSLTDYYLKIQALTPITSTDSQTVTAGVVNNFQIPTLSVVIFLAVLIVGAFALLLTKSHQLNKMFFLLTLAFILSAVPLTIQSTATRLDYQSQAGPILAPKNIVVKEVTSSRMIITWVTDKPETGAIRLGPTSSLGSDAKIYSEDQTELFTNHQLEITSLQPRTRYYFILLSGSQWFNDQGKPIEVKTASSTP
jgi:hypothetical protein